MQFRVFLQMNDGTNALAFVHQVEGFVDLLQRHVVRDELVDLEGSVQIFLHKLGDAINGLVAAESCSLPDATGNQLEWTSGDLLT